MREQTAGARAFTSGLASSRVGAMRAARAGLAAIAGLLLMFVLLPASTAVAHPLGLTRVTVTFAPDRSYAIDIIVDPESLLAKLEILSARQPSGIVPLDQLPARIGALQGVLQSQTRVVFDEQQVTPAFAYIPGAFDAAATVAPSATASAPTATVRLTGQVPPGAKHFRFNYGLVLGSYVLTVRSGSAEAAVDTASANATATTATTSTTTAITTTTSQLTFWIAGGQDSDPIDLTRGLLPASRLSVARQYFVLGFEHILPKGIDHILFVIGIFLLSTAWRPILLQVTTFTIAHSITLGLTMYGIVSLPSTIVEPLIALSITYVAVENLWTSELKPWRLALVFAFGLLHGMGFAGVLRELGLPRSEFLTALLTFNLGVEAGQLAVIGIALLVVGWWRQHEQIRYRQWVVIPTSILIALVGAYWTIVRALG